ncbi:hypothetical protein B0T20DRAFT_400181, partial [Sordaria brevicollis]
MTTGCQDGGTARGKVPCRGYRPLPDCNSYQIPDGHDPAERAYNYHIWACWTESARPANNRSTRLHPSHEMPRSKAGARRALGAPPTCRQHP